MPLKTPVKSQYAPFFDCPPLMKEFLDYTLTIRGRSARTVDGYYIDLRSFFRFLKQYRARKLVPDAFKTLPIDDVTQELIASVTLSDVYAFLQFAANEFSNGAYARARKASALSSFYKYVYLNKTFLPSNPLQNLQMTAKKKALPKYLTLKESNLLLDTALPEGKEREYCMLTLFLNCGMRLSELVGINRSDIRSDDTLRLLGKGNKERIVYLNAACKDAITAYLQSSKEILRNDDALFVSKSGKRLTGRRVEQLVEACLKDAGLSGYTPHKLRHTAATLMYQHGGVDVRVLKELLGHANLATTEIYTHVSNQQLEDAAVRSPLSGRKSGDGKTGSEE